MKIKAAIAHPSQENLAIREVELDEPRDDEILVRIHAVGVCHTDILVMQGALGNEIPLVLGHEGAGVVERVGPSVSHFKPGDRVALSYGSCGNCSNCHSGHPAYCRDFMALNFGFMRSDGSCAIHDQHGAIGSNFFGQSSFATYALTSPRNCVHLPDEISFEIGAPFGCAVQTGAGSVLAAMDCPAGSTLVITGCGPVGLSAVMGAKLAGCRTVIVAEPVAARRSLALEFGATHAIDPADTPNLCEAIQAIEPQGIEFALDTTGRADILDALFQALSPAGLLGFLGTPAGGAPLPGNLEAAILRGIRMMGIIEGDCAPSVFLPKLFDLHRQGKLPVERMITSYPFERINEAITDQHLGNAIKVVLTMA